MSQLVFRCPEAKRLILTGISMEPGVFGRLQKSRSMICRFCGQEHPWELVDRWPEMFALMSLKAEDYLARSVHCDALAADADDPQARKVYARVAQQWFELAVEYETKADAVS